jgi:hypothetical protein
VPSSSISTGTSPAGFRHLAGRIEPQEILAPFPDPLGLERGLELLFAQHDADQAAAGIERQVKERAHARGL